MNFLRKISLPLSLLFLILFNNCNPDDKVEVQLPELSETTVTEVNQTMAKFDSDILSDGGGEIFTKGFVFNTSGNPNESDENLIAISGTEIISVTASGLKEDTQYFVRSFAINAKGIAFGAEAEFTTSKTIVSATVTTDLVSEIDFTQVKVAGTVSNEGNGTVSERGFVWGLGENPTIDLDTKQVVGVGLGSFSTQIENLTEATTYNVRAYAINEFGVAYGEQKAFTTLSRNTIFEELELDANLSIFTSELKNYPDLVALLDNENSSYTLFAPTNDALEDVFSVLGINSLITMREEIAKGILAYHVIFDFISSDNLIEGSSFMTLQGESFNIENGPKISSGATSEANFKEFDRNAINGKIHIIESIIIPPTIGALIVSTLGTLAEPIVLAEDFRILYQGIKKADEGKEPQESILGTLQSASDLTFFAPTNATFEVGFITVDSWTSEQWNSIVRNHIVIGQGNGSQNTLDESDLITGSQYTTTLGGTLLFIHDEPNNGTGVFIDSDNDYDATNLASTINGEIAFFDAVVKSYGRIHVIAGILEPES